MKILVVIPHQTLLRREGHLHRLAGFLELLHGNSFSFLMPQGVSVESLQALGFSNFNFFKEPGIGNFRIPYFLGWSRNFRSSLIETIKRESIELVIFDFPWGEAALPRGMNIPSIYFSHGVERDFSRVTLAHYGVDFWPFTSLLKLLLGSIERRAAQRSKLVITMSARDADIYAANYKISRSKLFCLPHPAVSYTPRLSRSVVRAKFKVPMEKKIIVFHGSQSHSPNREAVRFMLNEIAPKLAHREDLHLLICGNGWEEKSFQNVTMLGFVPDLKELLSACDIALVPIFTAHGAQMKILDYLSVALPIVSTEAALQGYALKRNEDVILSEESAEAMTVAILKLADHPEVAERIVKKGTLYLSERHSPQSWRSKLIEQMNISN